MMPVWLAGGQGVAVSYDHWKTGGDSPGISDDQQRDEAREREDELADAERDADDEDDWRADNWQFDD